MKRIDHFLISLVTVFALAVTALPVCAEDLVLYPGYVAGTVSLGDSETKAISANAYGGGYSSSNHMENSADYQLTVQGGDWDTSVSMSATVGSTNSDTSISFNTRTLQVRPNETVPNDYVYNTGVIRFHVSITGDSYRHWTGWSRGEKEMPAGEEKTASYSSTKAMYQNDIFDMPVVANQQIEVYCNVKVNDLFYSGRSYSYDFGMMDVAPGQVIDLYINIDYVKVPPPPSNPNYDYGFLEGNIQLNNIAPGDFLYHKASDSFNCNPAVKENPGYYRCNRAFYSPINPWLYLDLRPISHFAGDGYDTPDTLAWPWPDDSSLNFRAVVFPNETTYKDLELDTGLLKGKLKLSGTVSNGDLYRFDLRVSGKDPDPSDPSPGTYGGSANYGRNSGNMTEDYRVYLSEGKWNPAILGAWRSNSVRSSKMYLSDLRQTYNPNYDWSEGVYINVGETTYRDLEYCMGSIIFRFRDAGGGTMSRPLVRATGWQRNANNQTEVFASLEGQSNEKNVISPEVEIFGPPADYSVHNMYVYASDGSLISFPYMYHTIKCNVTKYVDVPGPDIDVTSPQNELITNAESVAVTGTAISLVSISGLTVNEQMVPYESTGNPDDAGEVSFMHDLPLNDGANTITTTVTDASGARASDERQIYVDRWLPEISVFSPEQGQVIWFEDSVTAQVSSYDRGYGFKLKVYLDGELIYEHDGEGNDSAPARASYTANLGVLAVGNHILSAEVVDLAGNSSSTSSTFTVYMDITPPVTTPSLTGSSGNNSWYVSGVNVNLTATDDSTGVKKIHYTINGVETVVPSASANLSLAQNGIYDITYWAVDNSGNVEAAHTLQVKVDQTAPVISIIGAEDGGTYSICEPPTPGYNANDNLSGIATEVSDLVVNGHTHTYTVSATDYAGNTTLVPTVYTLVQVYSIDLWSPLSLNRPLDFGSTVPLKFTMTDCYGNEVYGHTVSLTLQKTSGEEPVGEPLKGTSNVPDQSNIFRGGEMGVYIYNLDTTPLSVGSWMATVTFETGQQETIIIQLR